MRNCLSYIGILAVAFVNITGMVGCARGREPETPKAIASESVTLPTPTPGDSDQAQKALSEAWSSYWQTQYARAKATVCK